MRRYDQLTLEEAKKLRLRLKIKIRNGNMEVPAGTVVTVTNKLKGWTIKTDPCKCCGVSVYVSRVSHFDLEEF